MTKHEIMVALLGLERTLDVLRQYNQCGGSADWTEWDMLVMVSALRAQAHPFSENANKEECLAITAELETYLNSRTGRTLLGPIPRRRS